MISGSQKKGETMIKLKRPKYYYSMLVYCNKLTCPELKHLELAIQEVKKIRHENKKRIEAKELSRQNENQLGNG